jgi:UDP-N-acetylmuramate dehydrogenase
MKHDIEQIFFKKTGSSLRRNVSLAGYSSFRIGGRADYFLEALGIEDLKKAVSTARFCSLPFYVIGGGYNILFSDLGFRGLVIRNRSDRISLHGRSSVEVDSGASLERLLQFCLKEGLSGLEFLAGIPGTVGGAVFGNAGAFKQCIGDFLERAFLWTAGGEERTVNREDLHFDYRDSVLKKTGDLLLGAVFRLTKGDTGEIRSRMEENIGWRENRHPSGEVACAGSYFKNPDLPDGKKVAAARLLDEAGVKGLSRGDAVVSKKHANFIINQGRATASDVRCLAEEMKKRVRDKFRIELREEVIFLPASPEDF